MKILQINSVYKNGSTGKITADIHYELVNRGIQSVVLYGRGKKVKESGVYKTCGELYSKINNAWSRISGLMYGGLSLSTDRIIRIIKKEKPDIVHLQCINGYFVNIFKLVSWLKKHKIKTVLTLHAEFMHTANCGYALDCDRWKTGCGKCPRLKKETRSLFFDNTRKSWLKMKKAFDDFNEGLVVVSVSPWLMERAKQSPILADKDHRVIYNGLDTAIFKRYDTQRMREELGLKDKKIIFHATPSFDDNPNNIKGGYHLLELAREMQDDESVVFVIAGRYPEGFSVPKNIILLGQVTDQVRLAEYYSMADITLLVSKKETFSMVCAESLCCGTPVVGFKAGAPEQISLTQYSEFVEQGDISALREAIARRLVDCDKKEIEKDAHSVYGKAVMSEKYISIYSEMIKA